MVLVGAFARIDPSDTEAVRGRLGTLVKVELFDLDEPFKVGLLIEAEDLEQAYETLTETVKGVEGVLGVWPVYVHVPDEGDPDRAREAVVRQSLKS